MQNAKDCPGKLERRSYPSVDELESSLEDSLEKSALSSEFPSDLSKNNLEID